MASRSVRNSVSCLAAAAFVCAGMLPARASEVLDPVSISLGGYYTDTNTTLKAATNNGDVATGDLKLEQGHESIPRARLDFVFLGSQGFSFDFFSLSHQSTQTLNQPFTYEGIPFDLNSTINGKLDFTAGSASYRWWFGSDSDVVGLGLGATYYHARLNLGGTATLEGISTPVSVKLDENEIAPLVVLGFKHAFSDSLRLYFDASGVRKNGGRVTGHIYGGRLGMEWFPWKNAGVGAEYEVTRIKLDRRTDGYDAKMNIRLHGPSLFARFRF